MMDAAYLLRSGPNEEFRMSLRSLDNMPHGAVWSFGGKPDWFGGMHVPSIQPGPGRPTMTKHRSTSRAMIRACTTDALSNPFVYMNDDFYIMQGGDDPALYHRGTILSVLETNQALGIDVSKDRWLAGLHQTRLTLLEGQDWEPLCFDVHIPMPVHKKVMLQALPMAGWKRSLYGNLMLRAGADGHYSQDVKLFADSPPSIPRQRYLSASDGVFNSWLGAELAKRFPTPSPYEILERNQNGQREQAPATGQSTAR